MATAIPEVPGLILVRDFITDEEHEQHLARMEEEEEKSLAVLKHSLRHWGFSYTDSGAPIRFRTWRPVEPFPEWTTGLVSRLKVQLPNFFEALEVSGPDRELVDVGFPNQLVGNWYKPGQGIADHVDEPDIVGRCLATLSLESTIVMDFKHLSSRRIHSLPLPPKSLLIMTGASRYQWTHGIAFRKTDRHVSLGPEPIPRLPRCSLTFRFAVVDYNPPRRTCRSSPKLADDSSSSNSGRANHDKRNAESTGSLVDTPLQKKRKNGGV
jgi:hypothetical protein